MLEDYMRLEYKEVPEPVPKSNEVLVKVKAAGICGSDVHGIDGSTGRRIPPIIMGHEASGIIEGVGSTVTGWKKGDRVTFDSTIYKQDDWYSQQGMYNLSDDRMVLGVSTTEFRKDGAFAEYVTVPEHILYPLPSNVSFTDAALTEPAAVALHGIYLSGLQPQDTVVVIGAGMVGMFVIQLLRIKSCKNIIAIDPEASKLELARASGAHFAFAPGDDLLTTTLRSLTGNRGADIVIEVVGISKTVNMAVDIVRKGGTIVLIGNVSPNIEWPLQKVVTRQLRLQGSCAINGEYTEVLQLASEGTLNMRSILSAESPLQEGGEWFQRLYNKEKGLMKIILKP